MNTTTTLTGVVLCGGKSTRMGTDKGLLLKDGQSWAFLAFQKLKEMHLPVYLSINASQKETYAKIFEETVLIEDVLTLPGPLTGLLSVHRALKNQDLLLLACDVTDVSSHTVEKLLADYRKRKDDYDFFVYKNDTEYEPMLGIYSHKGLEKIEQLLADGKLHKFSMKHLLETCITFSLPVMKEQQQEFRNYNTKEDLPF